MKVINLLDQLEQLILAAPVVPLTKKSMIDKDAVAELLGEIKRELPVELEEAGRIVESKERTLEAARGEAEQLLKEAEAKRSAMTSEHEIVKNAKRTAHELLTQTNEEARELEESSQNYAIGVLEELHSFVARYSEQMMDNFNDCMSVVERDIEAMRTESEEE